MMFMVLFVAPFPSPMARGTKPVQDPIAQEVAGVRTPNLPTQIAPDRFR